MLHLLSESDAVRAAAAAAGVGVGARPLGAATAADPNPPDRALLSALRCCSSIATDAAARCAYLAAKVPIDEAALSTSVASQLRENISPLKETRPKQDRFSMSRTKLRSQAAVYTPRAP